MVTLAIDTRAAIDSALAGETAAVYTGTGSVHVFARGRTVFVGAHTTDDSAGCPECATLWLTALVPSAADRVVFAGADWASALDLVLRRVAADGADWHGRLVALDTTSGTMRTHRFVPHPDCARCAALGSTPVPLDLVTPQPASEDFRTRSYDRDQLTGRLVDAWFGPIPHVYRDEASPLALVTAETAVPGHAGPDGTLRREGGYGRGATFTGSEVPAVLEGVERVLGGYRHAEHPAELTSRAALLAQGRAVVDLPSLGGHLPEVLADDRTPYVAPGDDVTTTWVDAWSTRDEAPVAVPEHVAYWHTSGGHPMFVYESSNGCAVGGSLEEAVLYGLFEVIERDAFLLAWYSRSSLTEIVIDDDGEFAASRDVLRDRGVELRLFDLTSDFGVPVALAVATADEDAVRTGRAPAVSLASGSNLDPAKAIRTAIEECLTNAVMYPRWVEQKPEVSTERCRPMLDDFSLVRTLDDHTGLHGLWEARALNEFIRTPAGRMSEVEFASGAVDLVVRTGGRPDVAATLRALLARTHDLGMDAIVVDQSVAVYRDLLGVHAVKVIMPGTVPMTFGHRNRRVVGIPRLARAANILRGARAWTSSAELNPVPHPFP